MSFDTSSTFAKQAPLRLKTMYGLGSFGVLVMLMMVVGCQFGPDKEPLKWPWQKDDEPALPDRIVAVWTDTVLHQPNQPGVRGFGGRVYFYKQNDTTPIKVDGGLAVYVFDADDVETSGQKPLRKFVFKPDQLPSHMSRTNLGPSYSFWLPWGPVGGPPLRLSLIARFEGTNGGTVISDPTIKLLPGVPVKQAKDEGQSGSEVQLASGYQDRPSGSELPTSSPKKPRREIESIDLPPSFQEQLKRNLMPASSESNPGEQTTETSTTTLPSSTGAEGNNENPGAQVNRPQETSAVTPPGNTVLPTSLAGNVSASPTTTQVFDYRNRGSQFSRGHSMIQNRAQHLRRGRWIESIDRR